MTKHPEIKAQRHIPNPKFNHPKTMLVAVILFTGIVVWFLMGKPGLRAIREQTFIGGCELNEAEYSRAMVYEALTDVHALPAKFSLDVYAPEAMNQGSQASCVGWALAYAARTILEAINSGKPAQQRAFSPASLYNQISPPNCQSTTIYKGLQAMKQNGVLPMQDFSYDENDCSRMPPPSLRQKMGQFNRIGFHRLSVSDSNHRTHLNAIKQNISQGKPVIIGMMVGGSFLKPMNGKRLWNPNEADHAMVGFFGHAMCVIAYDDELEGGALQVLNSWGKRWGQQGKAWIRYRDFLQFNHEAYSLFLMDEPLPKESRKVDARLALINANSDLPYPLYQQDKALFNTRTIPEKDSSIRLEIANESPCYIYIYGIKKDGSNTILFPYSPQHSPYFGIQGLRHFPLPESRREAGLIALSVIASVKELDYNKIKQYLNSRRENSYSMRWQNLLGPALPAGLIAKETQGSVRLETTLEDNQIVYLILQIESP